MVGCFLMPLNFFPPRFSERITLRQAQVDKLYAGLKDLAEERRGRLQERLRLTGMSGPSRGA